MFDANTFLTIIGLLIGVGVQTFGLVKYLINRMDAQRKELERQTNDEVTALHERVNTVKDEYVKRVDLDRDLNSLKDLILSIKTDTHKAMADIKADQHQIMTQINARLDALATTIANCGNQ